MANETLSRRAVLTALPAAGAAISNLAISTQSASAEPSSAALLGVLHELEDWQGWEPSCIVAAKAYAAYRLRQALQMELPDPEYAQLHLEYQNQTFESYRRSLLFERAIAEGKTIIPPLPVEKFISG